MPTPSSGVTDKKEGRPRRWEPHCPEMWPFRFMTVKAPDVVLRIWNGHNYRRLNLPEHTELKMKPGETVKIVMASRFGDVGITNDLQAEVGYHLRVDINDLDKKFENFRDEL